jgi:nitrous oxidase accessory protein NosD
MIELALALIQLLGPDGQIIEINPESVVTVRTPRGTDHFAKDIHCIVFTADGKNIAVVQTCDQVKELLGATQ